NQLIDASSSMKILFDNLRASLQNKRWKIIMDQRFYEMFEDVSRAREHVFTLVGIINGNFDTKEAITKQFIDNLLDHEINVIEQIIHETAIHIINIKYPK